MLNQVVAASLAFTRIFHQLPHTIKLVVAWEDYRLCCDFLVAKSLFVNLEMNKAGNDVKKTISL